MRLHLQYYEFSTRYHLSFVVRAAVVIGSAFPDVIPGHCGSVRNPEAGLLSRKATAAVGSAFSTAPHAAVAELINRRKQNEWLLSQPNM